MRNYFILLVALFSLSTYAQSLDIDGETKHWEYNINGGLNTDGWQWDTGIAYYPIETIGFKLAFGFAGEIHELSDWDFGYYEDYYHNYDKDYTVRFKFMPSLVLRTPQLIRWDSAECSLHLFAEPGLILSPGAEGSRNAETVRYNFRGGINIQSGIFIISAGYEYSNFSLYSGYPYNEHGLPDNDNYTTHSGFLGLAVKF